MKICKHCSKELMDEAVICPGCGCPAETEKKCFCQKCRKEINEEAAICPNCGCPTPKFNQTNMQQTPLTAPNTPASPKDKESAYIKAASSSAACAVLSAVVLVAGIVVALFVHAWVGVALCLAAELIATIPNTRLQSTAKQYVNGADKVALKAEVLYAKQTVKRSNGAFGFCFVLMIISLVCLIVFAVIAGALGI